MVKLKLNREQLTALCGFTNPSHYEAKADNCIQWQNFNELDMVFNMIEIGEKVAKQWLFTNKNKYSIRLKYSEAASLLRHTSTLEESLNPLSYELNFIMILRSELHSQLTNYQRRFYVQANRSGSFIGANNGNRPANFISA